jgi:Flp pilus assembly CpaE family ATPase
VGKAVVVATRRAREILPLLRGWDVREALTTDGVQRALRGAVLVILDEALPEGTLSRSGLDALLERAGVLAVSPDEFLTSPEAVLARARRQGKGEAAALSPLKVGIAALSGGTGCTTLALELARWTARRATVAVLEIPWGMGALGPRLNLNGNFPDLYQVGMGLREPGKAEGMTVVPAGPTLRLMLGNPDAVAGVVERLAREHVLVVVDAHAAHPLWSAVRGVLDRVLVVADPRPDAVANARALLDELGGRADLVLNRAGVTDRAALLLAGERALIIPDGARDIGERLGRFLWGGK